MKPKFRQTLFWDTDPDKLDYDKNARYVVGRVFDFGNLEDIKTAQKLYGLERLREIAMKHAFFSPRHIPFWAMVLNIPENKLSCIRNVSLQLPHAFLMR